MPRIIRNVRRPWQPEKHQESKERKESKQFYKTKSWRQLRLWHLRKQPLCVMCAEDGLIRQASVVDHIEPYRINPARGLDPTNLRSLCKECHHKHSGTQSNLYKKR